MLLETGILFVGYKTFALIPLIAAGVGALGASMIPGAVAATVMTGAAIGGSLGMQYSGSKKAADAARDQAKASNEAVDARFAYDIDMWEMKKQQMQAKRNETIEAIEVAARNEGKQREYKDAAALKQHNYALQIRNKQQASNQAAYKRSDQIYWDQLSLNDMASKAAADSEIIKLEENYDEAAFDRNEAYLNNLLAEGQMRARIGSGRSGVKGLQTVYAEFGRDMAVLEATTDSFDKNTRAVLEEIKRDKWSANLVAYANKMLDPGVLPMPITPDPIPVAEYTLPRAWQDYDFGPKPIRGAISDPGAAADMVWGNAMTSIAGTIGGIGMNLMP